MKEEKEKISCMATGFLGNHNINLISNEKNKSIILHIEKMRENASHCARRGCNSNESRICWIFLYHSLLYYTKKEDC